MYLLGFITRKCLKGFLGIYCGRKVRNGRNMRIPVKIVRVPVKSVRNSHRGGILIGKNQGIRPVCLVKTGIAWKATNKGILKVTVRSLPPTLPYLTVDIYFFDI
jgi:hypothetical protein